MASSLPRFSKGLKLARIGIIVMLLQLGLTIVMTVRSMSASDADSVMSVVKWTNYLMLASTVSAGMLLAAVAMSIGELKRVGLDVTGMMIALVGFAVATAAYAWTYHVFGKFVDIVLHIDDDAALGKLAEATKDLEALKFVAIVKDIGYGLGLIFMLRTVQRSAAANDQLALRDEAGHMSRAIIVMLAGDLFYQLTYGLGGGVGLLGAVGSLLLGGYWIWCHLKLVRFFENAAHFVNEPHDLPTATLVKVPELEDLRPAPPPRASRPSLPKVPGAAAPPPILVVPPTVVVPPAPIATPRPTEGPTEGTDEGTAPVGDGPRFLR